MQAINTRGIVPHAQIRASATRSEGEAMPEYLTVKQVAELLDMHPASVRKAIQQGRLPAKKFGRDHQILKAAAVAYRSMEKGSGGRPRQPRPDETPA